MSESTPTFPVLASDPPQEVWVIRRPRPRWWLYVLFFLLTMFSTTVVGARMEFNYLHRQPVFSLNDDTISLFPISWAIEQPSNLLLGLPFSLTLMFILFAHEMGHYLYCAPLSRLRDAAVLRAVSQFDWNAGGVSSGSRVRFLHGRRFSISESPGRSPDLFRHASRWLSDYRCRDRL